MTDQIFCCSTLGNLPKQELGNPNTTQ
jgi:hypothetical protein